MRGRVASSLEIMRLDARRFRWYVSCRMRRAYHYSCLAIRVMFRMRSIARKTAQSLPHIWPSSLRPIRYLL
jgi:hypothetical protein